VDERWNSWLERGRALLSAPPLSRKDKAERGPEDPKWSLGDLLLEMPEHLVDRFALMLGEEKGTFHRLREVAEKWPAEHRVRASWSAHRDLKDHPERFTLIVPGMSVRAAAVAAGKKPIDAKPRERMTLEERAAEVIALLADKKVNDLVISELTERRETRRKVRAARAAADERSAEYKEALRRLHEAQAAKSPDRAFLEVVFKMQETAEYTRAVVDAATDEEAPLVPQHRIPDLLASITAVRDAADRAIQALSGKGTDGDAGMVIDVEVTNSSPAANLLESTATSNSDQ